MNNFQGHFGALWPHVVASYWLVGMFLGVNSFGPSVRIKNSNHFREVSSHMWEIGGGVSASAALRTINSNSKFFKIGNRFAFVNFFHFLDIAKIFYDLIAHSWPLLLYKGHFITNNGIMKTSKKREKCSFESEIYVFSTLTC